MNGTSQGPHHGWTPLSVIDRCVQCSQQDKCDTCPNLDDFGCLPDTETLRRTIYLQANQIKAMDRLVDYISEQWYDIEFNEVEKILADIKVVRL